MKKRLVIPIVIVILLSGVEAERKVGVLEKTYLFSKPLFMETKEGLFIHLNGTNKLLLRENSFILPIRVDTFFFPVETRITRVICIPMGLHREKLQGKPLVTPPIAVTGIKMKEGMVGDGEETMVDTWLQYDIGYGIHNDERGIILKIRLYPLHYHLGFIEWVDSIKIRIEYETTVNNRSETIYQLLMLTPSEFEDELQPLVEHRIHRGIKVKLVKLEEIYDNTYFHVLGRDKPERIKYFIKEAVDNWGVTSVLLVGGSKLFPVRFAHVYTNGYTISFASDLYYADLYDEELVFQTWDTNNNNVFGEYNWYGSYDEMDLYPDIHVGRITCNDEEELEVVVDKIISYEENESYNQDWFRNIILCGGNTVPPPIDESDINEGELVNSRIIEVMRGFTAKKLWVSNKKLDDPTGINEAIESGAGFIDFSGHGDTKTWFTYPPSTGGIKLPPPSGYNTTHIETLSNHGKLPVVVVGACNVGRYTLDENCFCWSLLSQRDGGGVAVFGPTHISFSYIGERAVDGLNGEMQIDLFKAYADGASTVGEMWSQALNIYIPVDPTSTDYLVTMEYQLFGDPMLNIRERFSKPPEKPVIRGPSHGRVGRNYGFKVYSVDPDGDNMYYYVDWGDNTNTGWIGPYDANATIEVSHSWAKMGRYVVKVRARDDNGLMSTWSNPLIIRIRGVKSLYRVFR